MQGKRICMAPFNNKVIPSALHKEKDINKTQLYIYAQFKVPNYSQCIKIRRAKEERGMFMFIKMVTNQHHHSGNVQNNLFTFSIRVGHDLTDIDLPQTFVDTCIMQSNGITGLGLFTSQTQNHRLATYIKSPTWTLKSINN